MLIKWEDVPTVGGAISQAEIPKLGFKKKKRKEKKKVSWVLAHGSFF